MSQMSMFAETNEDLPLFSRTPTRIRLAADLDAIAKAPTDEEREPLALQYEAETELRIRTAERSEAE